MCTSIALAGADFCFGRTLDLGRDFGDGPITTPRNHTISFRCGEVTRRHYAFIGMATVIDGCPLYADGMNECGVCIAALEFRGNAYYPTIPSSGRRGVAPFEVIPYLLSKCESLSGVQRELERICIVDVPFNDEVANSPLHWHIADQSGSLVLESTKCGMKVYENRHNVLANNPPFPFHRDNCTLYLNSTNQRADNDSVFCNGVMGHGIPGDYTSPSRFVRAAWLTRYARCDNDGEGILYSLLSSVAPPRGTIISEDGEEHYARYTCVMCPNTLSYSYKRAFCTEIQRTCIKKESLDGETLI